VPFDFSPYAAVLLDLDGTIYHDRHVLPGAAALVRRLHAECRKYACLSNSTESAPRLHARLATMGVDIPADHIFTAAHAAADYALAHFPPRPRVFDLATQGLHEILEGRVTWVRNATDPCDCVICGAPANVYATEDRQRVALYLLRAGARLIGICADRVYPSPRGLEIGVGALAHMLAYAAGVTPTFVGKPEPVFFEELCQHLDADPAQCILVGDNPETDIAGARHFGMKTILTLTGVITRADVERIPANLTPDLIIPDLTHL
jgi:HAD superfamily hydrolase (TIGR01450 family)